MTLDSISTYQDQRSCVISLFSWALVSTTLAQSFYFRGSLIKDITVIKVITSRLKKHNKKNLDTSKRVAFFKKDSVQ